MPAEHQWEVGGVLIRLVALAQTSSNYDKLDFLTVSSLWPLNKSFIFIAYLGSLKLTTGFHKKTGEKPQKGSGLIYFPLF